MSTVGKSSEEGENEWNRDISFKDDSAPHHAEQCGSHQSAEIQPRVVDLAHVLVATRSRQSHSFSVKNHESVEAPNSAILQGMRLAQSRARLAEDSLKRIETACRDTWRQLLLQETERAEELRQVEAGYLIVTEHGKDGSNEESTSRRHPHSQESSQVQPQLAKKPRQRGHFLLAMSPLPRTPVVADAQPDSRDAGRNLEQGTPAPAKTLSVLRHKEVVLMQKEILRLRQDVGAAQLARQTLEARLGGCIVFQPSPGQSWGDGAGRSFRALEGVEGLPVSISRQMEAGEGRKVGDGEAASDDALRQEVAELRQQTAVANRLALEAMGGVETADAALQGVMERCQWELQQSSRKLADCQQSCEALRKSTQRLQRHIDRGKKKGGGEEGNGSTLQEAHFRDILRRVGLAKFWAAARVLAQRGLTRGWDFFRKHFLLPTKHLLVTAGLANAIGLGGLASWDDVQILSHSKGEGDVLSKSTLSPSPTVAWKMGPVENEEGEELGEHVGVERFNGGKRGLDQEEQWHMVFLIYVVFTWQEVTDI